MIKQYIRLVIPLLLCLLCQFQVAYGQTSVVTSISTELQTISQAEQEASKHSRQHGGFWQAMLHFYKKYISSQDGPTCSFEPSCSVYAIKSIEKLGFLPGLMNAADRITRCNSRENIHYEEDEKSGLALDPAP